MNYMKIDTASISDGLGFRVVLWVSGCTIMCPGCHNPEAADFNAGKLFDDNVKKILFKALNKPWVKGLTISGGHPLESASKDCIEELVNEYRTSYVNKDLWLYTGRTLSIADFINDNAEYKNILSMCDYVVDGDYKEDRRDVSLAFRGSTNQRIIDVRKTLESGNIVCLNTKECTNDK